MVWMMTAMVMATVIEGYSIARTISTTAAAPEKATKGRNEVLKQWFL